MHIGNPEELEEIELVPMEEEPAQTPEHELEPA